MPALYIHIPFCVRRCVYCDFLISLNLSHQIPYIEGLIGEAKQYPKETIETIYLGGGTPSLLDPSLVCRLLEGIASHFQVSKEAEITLEANPETLTREKLKGYKQAGINRLSLGVQSTDQTLLLLMSRTHTKKDVYRVYQMAFEEGIENINIDLIFGYPTQTLSQWECTLQNILYLNPPHLSLYPLSLEKRSPLFHQSTPLPEEETILAMYQMALACLKESGYIPYEIANFAKPHRLSQHNLTYWRNLPSIGIGIGAYSYYQRRRYGQIRNIPKYLAHQIHHWADQPVQSLTEEVEETCFLNLRLLQEGLSEEGFLSRFKKPLSTFYPTLLSELVEEGVLNKRDGIYTLSESFVFVSNEVFERFLLS